jgi:hypothetical protein
VLPVEEANLVAHARAHLQQRRLRRADISACRSGHHCARVE